MGELNFFKFRVKIKVRHLVKCFQASIQILYDQYKSKREDGVSLSETPLSLQHIYELAIYWVHVRHRGDINHDPINKPIWKVHFLHNILQWNPFHRFISLMVVQLNITSGRNLFFIMISHKFIGHDNVIMDDFSRQNAEWLSSTTLLITLLSLVVRILKMTL